jgi:hypothetical protein
MPLDGAGGVVLWPVVAGGLVCSLAVRWLPLLKAKISTNTTTAMPAIQPQVAFDQAWEPAGAFRSR